MSSISTLMDTKSIIDDIISTGKVLKNVCDTNQKFNEIRIKRLKKQLQDLKRQAGKLVTENKVLKKELNLQLKMTNKLESSKLYDYMMTTVGEHKILEPAGMCRISHINSTAEFYIHFKNDIPKLLDIHEDLKRNMNNFVTIAPEAGEICVVFYPMLNYKWRRAQIISYDENGIKVQLIDYGNFLVVQQVYSLNNFSTLLKPPIAQECCLRLSRLGRFTTIAEEKFKEMSYIKGGPLLNVYMLKIESFNMVELFHNNRNITDDLISSQFEDELISSQFENSQNASDSEMMINSYSYRASMDDDELAN